MKDKDLFKICNDMIKDDIGFSAWIENFDVNDIKIGENKEKENPMKKFLKNNQKRIDIYKKR